MTKSLHSGVGRGIWHGYFSLPALQTHHEKGRAHHWQLQEQRMLFHQKNFYSLVRLQQQQGLCHTAHICAWKLPLLNPSPGETKLKSLLPLGYWTSVSMHVGRSCSLHCCPLLGFDSLTILTWMPNFGKRWTSSLIHVQKDWVPVLLSVPCPFSPVHCRSSSVTAAPLLATRKWKLSP